MSGRGKSSDSLTLCRRCLNGWKCNHQRLELESSASKGTDMPSRFRGFFELVQRTESRRSKGKRGSVNHGPPHFQSGMASALGLKIGLLESFTGKFVISFLIHCSFVTFKGIQGDRRSVWQAECLATCGVYGAGYTRPWGRWMREYLYQSIMGTFNAEFFSVCLE